MGPYHLRPFLLLSSPSPYPRVHWYLSVLLQDPLAHITLCPVHPVRGHDAPHTLDAMNKMWYDFAHAHISGRGESGCMHASFHDAGGVLGARQAIEVEHPQRSSMHPGNSMQDHLCSEQPPLLRVVLFPSPC